MMKALSRLALCVAVIVFAPTNAKGASLEVQSALISDEDFLRGDDSGAVPVTISGRLSGADQVTPVPVVILLHGKDGPRGAATVTWEGYLNRRGFTTLRLDSYTGRGILQTESTPDASGHFMQIYDAYRAADALAADSRYDGSRIVVMGFSRGGVAALYSAMLRFQEAFGPKQAKIVGHILFYPACNYRLERELEVSEAPIRAFHGENDNWAPAAPCRAYFERLKRSGADVAMTIFPGVSHAFDSPLHAAPYRDPANVTSRNCMRIEKNGVLSNTATGVPFSYDDICVEYGPVTQYDGRATEVAQEAVGAFLDEVFSIHSDR